MLRNTSDAATNDGLGRLDGDLHRQWCRCLLRIRCHGVPVLPASRLSSTTALSLKEGQTVFVSYDAAGGLQDFNGNSINPFSQIVINSSELYNDRTAPTISPDEFNKPSINADGQTISLNFSEDIDQASLQSALDNSSFQLFIDGEQRDDIILSFESNDDSDDGESSASYSPDLEQLEFDIEEGISVDGFNDLSLEQLKDAFTFTSEGNPVDVTITNIELVDEENPNSFILTFDSADFENYINGPGLDAEFDNENLGLKDVADENLISHYYLSVALADDMDASGMAYDASGNSSSSSFTLRINGSTDIESGQNVLLSYAIQIPLNTATALASPIWPVMSSGQLCLPTRQHVGNRSAIRHQWLIYGGIQNITGDATFLKTALSPRTWDCRR